VAENKYRALLQYKFCERAAAGSDTSGDPSLHKELPHIKNGNDATGDFKQLKKVGGPSFRPNL
jgi:hypothetical protein